MKQYASQSRSNVLRSTSISPLIIRKQRQQISINKKNLFRRPSLQSHTNSSTIKTNQQSRLTNKDINTKSEIVTYTTMIQPNQKSLVNNIPSTSRTTISNISKVRIYIFVFLFQIRFFVIKGISIK